MEERELAYLAGVVDGEGCVCLRMKRGGTLTPRLQVTNTNETLIDWILVRFGGSKHRYGNDQNPRYKARFDWHLNGEPAVALLRALAPFLVIKRAQADLAIYAWENRQPALRTERHKPVGLHIRLLRQGWADQMHDLNRKGA